jgi:predicted ATPase
MSRQRLFEALARLLEALTDIEPLPVLFIDDLHNAEPATIDLLRYLLCRLSQTAFWWVGAYRSDEIDETHALLRLRHAMEQQQRVALITLLPLESQAITQLAGVILGAEHHQIADLVAYLSDLSGGNAFLLEQFFRELERCGILSAGKDGMMLDGQRLTRDGIGVPAGVRAMIAARLGRLTSQAREVLRIAAVIGGSFHLSMLAPVVTQTTQELEESIELLLARGLIREIYCLSAGADPFPRTLLTHSPTLLDHGLFPTTLASGSTAYEFVYQATQQVIYANLSQGYRQRVIAALQQTQQQYAQQALPRWMPA